jgi:hypothetical protein
VEGRKGGKERRGERGDRWSVERLRWKGGREEGRERKKRRGTS